MRASPKEMLAAFETGIVESGMRNLGHGDRDSVGWRQERSHYGSRQERMNVEAGARRFFQETRRARNKYGTAGQLAQGVQRSGRPERYQQVSGQAKALLRQTARGAGGGAGGGDGLSRGPGRAGQRYGYQTAGEARRPVEPGGTGVAPILAQRRAQIAPVPITPPSAPSFSAQPRMPQGFTSMPSFSVPPIPAQPDVPEADVDPGSLRGPTVQRPEPGREVSYRAGEREGSLRASGASGAGGARPLAGKGWGGSQGVVEGAVSGALKRYGGKVTSTKRGTQSTASGGTSDHWTGAKGSYANDIGNLGINSPRGKKAAAAIARQFGMRYRPGTWNNATFRSRGRTYRIQLGYGGGLAGHDDHIHLGVKRVG